jgi:hypothetical protein
VISRFHEDGALTKYPEPASFRAIVLALLKARPIHRETLSE